MLVYLGKGQRWYNHKPVRVYPRGFWEFQAVVRGKIGLRLPEGPQSCQASSLWVTAPHLPHGWYAEEGPAEVVVFQFDEVPEQYRWLADHHPLVRISLRPAQCARLRADARLLEGHTAMMTPAQRLVQSAVLLRLSSWVLESPDIGVPASPVRSSGDWVDRACAWYQEHLGPDVSLVTVARALATSPATLRRHFKAATARAPRDVFLDTKMRAARDMLLLGQKHEEIAHACGYGSASAFSRAFKEQTGVSPREWQQKSRCPEQATALKVPPRGLEPRTN